MRRGEMLRTIAVLGIVVPTLVVPIPAWHHHTPACGLADPRTGASFYGPPDDQPEAKQACSPANCTLCALASGIATDLPLTPLDVGPVLSITHADDPPERFTFLPTSAYWARGPPAFCRA